MARSNPAQASPAAGIRYVRSTIYLNLGAANSAFRSDEMQVPRCPLPSFRLSLRSHANETRQLNGGFEGLKVPKNVPSFSRHVVSVSKTADCAADGGGCLERTRLSVLDGWRLGLGYLVDPTNSTARDSTMHSTKSFHTGWRCHFLIDGLISFSETSHHRYLPRLFRKRPSERTIPTKHYQRIYNLAIQPRFYMTPMEASA